MKIMAKEECEQKNFGQGLVSWSSLPWKFFVSSHWRGELQALPCTFTMSSFQQLSFPPTHKLLTRCHLFPGYQLYADSAHGQNVSSKHPMWVLNIWNLKPGVCPVWRMELPVPCRGKVTIEVGTATARALPGDGPLAFLSRFPVWNVHSPNGCRTEYVGSHIYRALLHAPVSRTLFHANEHQWAWSQSLLISETIHAATPWLAFLLL